MQLRYATHQLPQHLRRERGARSVDHEFNAIGNLHMAFDFNAAQRGRFAL